MNRKAKLLVAQAIVHKISAVMQRRGLAPVFAAWFLTEDQGQVWLFGVLDQSLIHKLEDYTRETLLHHLSTAIGGRPIYLSNRSGLRYAVLLSKPPRLPSKVNFPGVQRGQALLGQRYTGQPLRVPWPQLGHLLVTGKTGRGQI
ncbi:MAG: hypothetical protein U9Q70_02550 [Chloroflexota bacterium]|nr:hypothetical protein [Chloroflexota bacterium]